MNELTSEWLEKADADLGTARRELAVEGVPNPDAICFHAQQAVEKCLKALLQERDVAFPKSHDLAELLQLVSPAEVDLDALRERMDALTAYAVTYRYPGESATALEAGRALGLAEEAREIVFCLLSPPEPQPLEQTAEAPEDITDAQVEGTRRV